MRTEQIGKATLYLGDCREIVPTLPSGYAVLTDPPWGAKTKTDSRRFTTPSSKWWSLPTREKIEPKHAVLEDDQPFEPAPFLVSETILWGANWYADKLPLSGGWLIWDKRKGVEHIAEEGWPLSEAELAWTNVLGSTRVFRNLWNGLLRSSEKGEHYHPTQKPVSLMEWCIGFLKAETICDPFMGSGSTGVACASLDRGFIGVEKEQGYFDIACRRIEHERSQLKLSML
jgi:site-specific DNA-methyltransferase (adenine-specific)